MKKITLLGLLFALVLSVPHANAQFSDYGIRISMGPTNVSDNLSSQQPILGAGVGAYINYTFAQSKSVIAEIFYLQTGLNFNRRGHDFREVFEQNTNLRLSEGYCHALYVQLPILAGVHFELPVRHPDHIVGLFLGPTVSCGITGTYNERMLTPGNSDRSINYDLGRYGTPEQREAFNHINRLDVGAIIGISYQYHRFTLSLYLDHGFMPVAKDIDPLRVIDNNLTTSQDNKVSDEITAGNNSACLISLSYSLGSFLK